MDFRISEYQSVGASLRVVGFDIHRPIEQWTETARAIAELVPTADIGGIRDDLRRLGIAEGQHDDAFRALLGAYGLGAVVNYAQCESVAKALRPLFELKASDSNEAKAGDPQTLRIYKDDCGLIRFGNVFITYISDEMYYPVAARNIEMPMGRDRIPGIEFALQGKVTSTHNGKLILVPGQPQLSKITAYSTGSIFMGFSLSVEVAKYYIDKMQDLHARVQLEMTIKDDESIQALEELIQKIKDELINFVNRPNYSEADGAGLKDIHYRLREAKNALAERYQKLLETLGSV